MASITSLAEYRRAVWRRRLPWANPELLDLLERLKATAAELDAVERRAEEVARATALRAALSPDQIHSLVLAEKLKVFHGADAHVLKLRSEGAA